MNFLLAPVSNNTVPACVREPQLDILIAMGQFSTLSTFQSRMAIVFAVFAASAGFTMFLKGSGTRGLPGCGSGSACDEVVKGRWSKLGIVPVAFLGVLTYTAMASGMVLTSVKPPNSSLLIIHLLNVCAFLSIGAAVWFTALQVLVIQRLCAYCLVTHAAAVISAAIMLGGQSTWSDSRLIDVYLSGAMVSMLIVGQIAFKPRTHAITRPALQVPALPDPQQFEPPTKPAAIVATDQATPPAISNPEPYVRVKRAVDLYGKNVRLTTLEWPLLGPPSAPCVLAALLDFTCRECHHLHRLLIEAMAYYKGRVAVLVIPVPMNPDCNSTITCRVAEQAYACPFARLAWAVWQTKPERYGEWDNFLTESNELPPLGLSLLKAQEMMAVGEYNIRDSDPVLDRLIARGVSLSQALGKAKVPAVLLPGGVLHGHVDDLAALIKLLDPYISENSTADSNEPRIAKV